MTIRISKLFLKIGISFLFCDVSLASTPDRGHIEEYLSVGGYNHPEGSRRRSLSTGPVLSGSSRAARTPAKNSFDNYLPNRIIIPPDSLPSNDNRGYQLAEMDLIWLVCKFSPNRIFLFGKFQFPAVTDAMLKGPNDNYFPVPLNEQIVMCTPEGDVYALLDADKNFVGLNRNYCKRRPRVKMNMETKQVSILSKEETREIPVGSLPVILSKYQIHRKDLPNTDLYQIPRRFRSRSPPLGSALPETSRSRHTPAKNLFANYLPNRIILPPDSLPSNDKRGYPLAEMDFIWLVCKLNPNRIFLFGKFQFPAATDAILKSPNHKSFPVPLNEQIVMHTPDGEAYAILDADKDFVGLYMCHKSRRPRVKINMATKQVSVLGTEETKEIPVGSLPVILSKYQIHRKDHLPTHLCQ